MEDQPQQNENNEIAQKAEEILQSNRRRPRRLSGWKLALVVTSVLVTGIMTLVVIFALTLFKNPTFQEALGQYRVMVQCEENLGEIGAALIRYSKGNDEFPEKLEDLVPDYLASDSVFRCPADKHKDSGVLSYSYNRPKTSAPDDAVVSACPRHRTLKNQPPLLIELHKDGKVTHTPVTKQLKQ